MAAIKMFMEYKTYGEKNKYAIALDLSLANTGVCIFDKNGNPKKIYSIPTNKNNEHGIRLKTIGDELISIRKQYDIDLAIFEKGFTRFSNSTQAIFKVVGVASYIFYDCTQLFYSPSTVKKIVCGKGNAGKDEVEAEMHRTFPHLIFSNQDESDAVSIGHAYFLDLKSCR